jgi:Lar family restriction alleviation protein
MNKLKQELLHCPFCGHSARQYNYQTEYGTQRFAVQCTNCGAEIDTLSKTAAIRLWNKRVNENENV